jgi:hypothetical protein
MGHPARLVASLAIAVAIPACGDGEEELPPLTDATWLACPYPGDLPFRLETRHFAVAANADTAAANPRTKDESSDAIGNPGGLVGNTYLLETETLVDGGGTSSYRGLKARTGVNDGLFGLPLAGEAVSLWTYDTTAAAWISLGGTTTGDDGGYQVNVAAFAGARGQPIYAMLEGDGSCAVHYDTVEPPGTKVVITDVDGTLTTEDGELIKELQDGTYVAAMKGAADRLLETWAAKGYVIVYITARPHLFRAETRAWLSGKGMPAGAVITAKEIGDASAYKTLWLERMKTELGWDIVAAYGNADTDISAYANAGIPKAQTFIIWPRAGTDETVAIPNDDYSAHIASYVEMQPDAGN